MKIVKCGIQKYSWGKKGDSGIVGEIYKKNEKAVDKDTPYAEYWMGTHSVLPSKVRVEEEDKLMSEYLESVTEGKKSNLQFLFKVLSVGTALSIQAHPDSKLAAELHEKHPETYKDPNHKPEMTIALSSFEALCGFLPHEEIVKNLKENEVFHEIIAEINFHRFLMSSEKKEDPSPILKNIFSDILDSEIIEETLSKLISKLIGAIKKLDTPTPSQQLALRLHEQYGNDVGVLLSFLLNRVVLEPGESIAIRPNEPHAYLSGDCVECMATSDNVVRCGLTPKFKDVPTLKKMLNYSLGKECKLKPELILSEGDSTIHLYDAQIPEFLIYKLAISEKSKGSLKLKLQNWSILLVILGEVQISGKTTEKPLTLDKFSTLLLPPDEYTFSPLEVLSEIFIASEH